MTFFAVHKFRNKGLPENFFFVINCKVHVHTHTHTAFTLSYTEYNKENISIVSTEVEIKNLSSWDEMQNQVSKLKNYVNCILNCRRHNYYPERGQFCLGQDFNPSFQIYFKHFCREVLVLQLIHLFYHKLFKSFLDEQHIYLPQ